MLPFLVDYIPGAPISEQLIYAVKKATISGVLRPGERFPSIRILSQELRINPNTAQKVITQLTKEGFLEVHSGIGTIVGKIPPSTPDQRRHLLGRQMEQLVVEARQLYLTQEEVIDSLQQHWKTLS